MVGSMNTIAGNVSVVGPHARAGVATAALENDTRGATDLAGGGACRSPGEVAPTNPATGRGAAAYALLSSLTAQAPNTCANLAPPVPSRRGLFGHL